MSVRSSLVILTVATIGIPVLVFANRANQVVVDAQTEIQRIESLQLHRVGRGRVELTVSALGKIEADEIVGMSFLSPGKVAEVLVEEGDYVLAGDELVRLENEQQQLGYDEAILNLELQELQLQDLLIIDDADIRSAEARVNQAWGTYRSIDEAVSEQDIQAAQLRVQQAQDALVRAEEARRIAGGLEERSFAQLDAQIGQASFNLAVAQLQLQQLQQGSPRDLGAAYASVIQAQRQLDQAAAGPDQFAVERAEIAIQQAVYRLEQAETAYNRTILRAEMDGFISSLDVEEGQLVNPGVPVLQITDADPIFVEAEIDEVDIRSVAEGMEARISLDALPGADLPGQLSLISLRGFNDGSGIVSYPVQATFAMTDPRIRVGMTAEALVIVEERENVLIVPNFYIRLERSGDIGYVNVLQPDGTLQEVEVRLGLRGLENSEIVSGLSEGDMIAVSLEGDSFSFFGG